jgi:Glyoxalase-like domain
MSGSGPVKEVDRRLPLGGEIFLDHVAHFVSDPEAASRALVRAGFAPTPMSIQVIPDPAGGAPRPTGTGNVTCMLDRGYLEILFKTADTPLGQEFDAAMARYRGVRLAAFAVADAAATHARLGGSGFRLQPLVAMQRPVGTEAGEDIAAFSVVRVAPGEMPEGRIQALTHRTEHTVWQPRWLSQPNGARGLLDIVVAEEDVAEAVSRFSRFLDREPRADRFGPAFHLDRGCVQLVAAAALERLFPRLTLPDLPFMAAYGLAVNSLDNATACLRAGDRAFDRGDGCVIAPFPDELGVGCWVFVESAAALPWRRYSPA